MGTEVSTYLTSTITQLSADYPDFAIRQHDVKSPEETDSHLDIIVGVVSVEPGELDGTGDFIATVTLQADTEWRYTSASIHSKLHPLDIAVSLLAWSNNRYISPAKTICTPLGVSEVVLTDARGDADLARYRYSTQWAVDLVIDPSIDAQTPAAFPLPFGSDGPAVDLQELYVDNDKVIG